MDVDDSQVNATIDAIVASDQETGGQPALPADSRSAVEAWLQRILIDRQALRRHIKHLQDAFGTQFRHTAALDEAGTEAVLAGQWERLGDRELAALVLNPPALCCLQGLIDEDLPAAWLPAMERHGRELLAAHGRHMPDFEALAHAEPAGRGQGRARPKRKWPLRLAIAGPLTAAAAAIAVILLWPSAPTLDVDVKAYWPRASRGNVAPSRDDLGSVTAHVVTEEPLHVFIILRYAMGDLWIRPTKEDGGFGVLVDGSKSLPYPLWDDPPDSPDRGLLLSTHVVTLAAREELTEEQLTAKVPNETRSTSDAGVVDELEQWGQRMREAHGWIVVVRPIIPSEP